MKKNFSAEFKRESAQLVVDLNYTVADAAKAMDVGLSTMTRWVKRLCDERQGKTSKASHFGRDLHKHMDMICTAFSFKNPYAFPLTQLSQNTACCSTLLSVEHLSSVFGRKNYVIFTVPSGAR